MSDGAFAEIYVPSKYGWHGNQSIKYFALVNR